MDSNKILHDIKNICFYYKKNQQNDNELQVCFQFNLDIIGIIKTIDGYRYNEKKWFIPEASKNELSKKLFNYNDMVYNGDLNAAPPQTSLNAFKNDNQPSSNKKLKTEDDNLEPDQLRYILMNGKTIEIKLPINKDIWRDFKNYRDFQMYTINHSWYINGEENIKNFFAYCKINNYKIIIQRSLLK